MAKSFIKQFQEFLIERGTPSITDFLDKWIKKGGTFQSLYVWINENSDIKVRYFAMWFALRKYLTVPYDYSDQYEYKWKKLAKEYGYTDIYSFILHITKKYTTNQAAKILGVTTRNVLYMERRAMEMKGKPISYKPGKKRKRLNAQGFSHTHREEEWKKRLEKLGFTSLKRYVKKRRKDGWIWHEIADELNVNLQTLLNRMENAKIDYKSMKKG